ncbi:sodium:proton antiporter [soil metagenome]
MGLQTQPELLFVLLAVIGGTALVLGLTSRLLRDGPVTEPLAALVVGILIGPQVTGVVDATDVDTGTIGTVALIVLSASVMSTALRHPPKDVRAVARAVVILLAVALPVMAFASALVAALVVGLPAASAAVLGAVLAPTDSVLTSNAVNGEHAEHQVSSRLRTIISIESGSNDGLAAGLLFVCIAVALDASVPREIASVSLTLVASAVFGIAVGWASGRLLVASERHHDIEHTAFLVLTLSLVAVVLGITETFGGESVLAVFAAALAYAHVVPRDERRDEREVQEAVNEYLVLPVFTLLGIALPWSEWADLGWAAPGLVLAVALVRRLPIAIGLGRALGVSRSEAFFLGWTGPVGVGSLYLASLAVEHDGLDDRIWAAATLVVATSVVSHGVTASTVRRLTARDEARD